MSLVKWAIFGLLLLPFVEIALFVVVVMKLGVLAALALTIATSLAGMTVIRHAGKTEVARVRSAFGERTVTRKELDGRGFLTVLGGFLLVLPGFLTDLLGLLLLLPLTQQLIAAALRRAAARMDGASGRPGVVDLPPGEWRRVPEERLTHKPSPGGD
ncbi:MAG: FxsA family protein [Alphaproteobacteria bacterium]|nr:MAG: FxsA family protein [Alphaproteobacteria bacterium]